MSLNPLDPNERKQLIEHNKRARENDKGARFLGGGIIAFYSSLLIICGVLYVMSFSEKSKEKVNLILTLGEGLN